MPPSEVPTAAIPSARPREAENQRATAVDPVRGPNKLFATQANTAKTSENWKIVLTFRQ